MLNTSHERPGAACLAPQTVDPFMPFELRVWFATFSAQHKLGCVASDSVLDYLFREFSLENRLATLWVPRSSQLPEKIFDEMLRVAIQSSRDGSKISENSSVARDSYLCLRDLEAGPLGHGLRHVLERAVEQFFVCVAHLLT